MNRIVSLNHAVIFSELSILLCLPAISVPHTENSLSTKACETGTDTASCTVNGRTKSVLPLTVKYATDYTFDSAFWGQNSMAVVLL